MYKEYLIGNKKDVEAAIGLLNSKKSIFHYRFEKMNEGKSLFCIVQEGQDYDDYAIVKVKQGKVYAVSSDAYQFIYKIFSAVLK